MHVTMEELAASANQFDLANGSLSCTAASVCCARKVLDNGVAGIAPTDLDRSLAAGAAVYRSWKSNNNNNNNLQCWTDVVRVFPAVMEGYHMVYETNGFIGNRNNAAAATALPLPPGYASFDDALDVMEGSQQRRTAGVLTARRGSYTVAYDNGYWCVFDPHGTVDSVATAIAPATLRRTRDRKLFTRYVVEDVLHLRPLPSATAVPLPPTEYQLVLFAAQAAQKTESSS